MLTPVSRSIVAASWVSVRARRDARRGPGEPPVEYRGRPSTWTPRSPARRHARRPGGADEPESVAGETTPTAAATARPTAEPRRPWSSGRRSRSTDRAGQAGDGDRRGAPTATRSPSPKREDADARVRSVVAGAVRGRAASEGTAGPGGRSGPGPLYSPGSPTPRARVRREGERRSLEATRPPRETDEPQPASSPGHWRREGAVYPGPGPHGRVFSFADPGRAAARDDDDRPAGGLMPATVIVGLQWGDEGKGKTTDFLAEQVAVAVRYQGGDNAGHTIMLGDEVFKLHLVPSGRALPAHHVPHRAGRRRQPGDAHRRARRPDRPRDRRLQGPGEPQLARDHALPPGPRPPVRGAARGEAVGTTHRGIGPAYADRASRIGLGWRTSSRGRRPAQAREGPAGQEPPARHGGADARVRGRAARRRRRSAWGTRLAGAPRRHDVARPGRPPARRARPPRGCAGHAPRPRSRRAIRTSRPRTRSPAAPAPVAASGRSRSTRSSGS